VGGIVANVVVNIAQLATVVPSEVPQLVAHAERFILVQNGLVLHRHAVNDPVDVRAFDWLQVGFCGAVDAALVEDQLMVEQNVILDFRHGVHSPLDTLEKEVGAVGEDVEHGMKVITFVTGANYVIVQYWYCYWQWGGHQGLATVITFDSKVMARLSLEDTSGVQNSL